MPRRRTATAGRIDRASKRETEQAGGFLAPLLCPRDRSCDHGAPSVYPTDKIRLRAASSAPFRESPTDHVAAATPLPRGRVGLGRARARADVCRGVTAGNGARGNDARVSASEKNPPECLRTVIHYVDTGRSSFRLGGESRVTRLRDAFVETSTRVRVSAYRRVHERTGLFVRARSVYW